MKASPIFVPLFALLSLAGVALAGGDALPEKARLPSTPDQWQTLASPALAEKDYVLIVGNASYLRREDQLPSADNDADVWSSFMKRGRQVPPQRVITKKDVDAYQLRESVRTAAEKAPAGGILWFIYSGHGGYGVLENQPDGSDNGPQRVLLGRLTRPETWRDDAVPLSWIERTLLSSKASRVVLVLDACYSKILPKEQRASFPRTEPDEPKRLVVWSAVERDQEASTYQPARQGLHVFLAIAALSGAADGVLDAPDRMVSLEEAHAWSSSQLSSLCVTQQTITLSLNDTERATWPVVDKVVPGWRDFSNLPPAFSTCKQIAEAKSAVDDPDSGSPLDPAKPKLDWISLPGGTFKMGSINGGPDEQPIHEVTLSPFKMTKTEVTVAQYRACVDAEACTKPHWDDHTCSVNIAGRSYKYNVAKSSISANRPVVCVDWEQADAFARWVGGRLPTEAEFEFAAKSGGKNQKYPWGNSDPTCERAVFFSYSIRPRCEGDRIRDVCSKPTGNTESGLCDMSGNVWEWTADWYEHGFYEASPSANPTGPDSSNNRVIRGGCWFEGDDCLRAANRDWLDPKERNDYVGFRVVIPSPRVGSP